MPLWLLEGFADYVALRDVDLPLSTTAGQIIEQVRREGAPTRCRAPRSSTRTDAHLGAAYESAWLACLVLADRGGEDELVDLYTAIGRRRGPRPPALRTRFGWTEQAFVEAWQQRLTDLAE